jgi:hypothetical protein
MILALVAFVGGVWRTVFMDNLFTSIHTFNELWKKGLYACGTCRAGRGMPKDLEKASGATKRSGDVKWRMGKMQDGGSVTAAQWFDSGPCCVLSTRHPPEQKDVLRHKPGQKERVPVPSLLCYDEYNKHMGAVDLADHKRAMLTCRQRTHKWWLCVFYWILDSAVINANVVRNLKKDELGIKGFGGREFVEELVDGLRHEALCEEEDAAAAVRAGKKMKGNFDRLVGRHFPANFGGKGKRCVVCAEYFAGDAAGNKKTPYGCKQCGEHMHIECFEAWHTQLRPVSGKS